MCENQLGAHLQTIWSNWRSRKNECENYVHWGNGGGSKPFYGVGQLSGDFPTVAFVARDPGPGGKPDIPELDKKEELGLTSREISLIEGHIMDEYSGSFSENREANIMQTGMCNGEYTEKGRPHSPQMKNCVESFFTK